MAYICILSYWLARANHLWKHSPRHTQECTVLISQASFSPIKLPIKINSCMANFFLISHHPDFTELTPK